MPTIVTTLWRRPEYTKRVFDSISQCFNIEKYTVLAFSEPDCQEVVDLAKKYHFPCKYSLTVNPSKLGCTKNIHQALKAGFDQDDFVILIEDDILLSKDALRYFEHCNTNYKNDANVFTVCGYTKNIPKEKSHHVIKKVPWFTPWGWATWTNRWEEIDAVISKPNEQRLSWDIITNHSRKNRTQIEPLLSRTQNIGAKLGTYCPSEEWHAVNCFNSYGAWSVQLENENFIDEEDNV